MIKGDETSSYWIQFLYRHAEWTLNVFFPVLWAFALVLYIDRDDFLSLLYMPFLGFIAAFLANSVPFGGGIVYIPALSLLGAKITLGTIFTLSIMPLGNGLLGFLNWLRKDSSLILWESFPYTVLPSWIGSFLAMSMLPLPPLGYVPALFGAFCFLLGGVVILSIYRGGLKNVLSVPSVLSVEVEIEKEQLIDVEGVEPALPLSSPSSAPSPSSPDTNAWSLMILISFLGGVVFVPNIGIGPALVTYFLLVYVGYADQAAMVTGIITGGWVCVLPLLLTYLSDPQALPYKLVIMVLPGVFFGAKLAPRLIDWVGRQQVMGAFALFLFASALLMWLH